MSKTNKQFVVGITSTIIGTILVIGTGVGMPVIMNNASTKRQIDFDTLSSNLESCYHVVVIGVILFWVGVFLAASSRKNKKQKLDQGESA